MDLCWQHQNKNKKGGTNGKSMASLEPGGVLSSQGNSRDTTNRRDIQLDRGHPGPRTGLSWGTGNWSCMRELVTHDDACRGHRQWGGHTLLQAFSLQTPLGAHKQDWQTPGSLPWCWCTGWADTAGGANPLVPLSPSPPAIKALTGEGKGNPGHSHGAPVKTHCSWEKETGTILSHRWGESRWERGQHREGQLSKIQDAYLSDRHLEQRTSLPLW